MLHSIFYIPYSTNHILHSIFYTLYSIFYMLHSIFYILYSTFLPYVRDKILYKRPIILSILLTVATPYHPEKRAAL